MKHMGPRPYGHASWQETLGLQTIIRMHHVGFSLRDIIKQLHALEIAAPGGGTVWHPNAVRRIIKRESESSPKKS